MCVCVAMSEADFKAALAYVTHGPKSKLTDAQQLAMYAAFKQATVGPNREVAPSAFKFVARAKYDAWKKLGDMSKKEAIALYLKVKKNPSRFLSERKFEGCETWLCPFQSLWDVEWALIGISQPANFSSFFRGFFCAYWNISKDFGVICPALAVMEAK